MIERFHNHLDVCPQCATPPFNLCHEGDRLLLAAVSDAGDDGQVAQSIASVTQRHRALGTDARLGAVEDGAAEAAEAEDGYGHGV